MHTYLSYIYIERESERESARARARERERVRERERERKKAKTTSGERGGHAKCSNTASFWRIVVCLHEIFKCYAVDQ